MLHGLVGGSWGGGGAAHPGKAEPLAKAEGPDCMSSDSQWDLTSGMLKVNSSAQRAGGREDTEGELLSPRRQSSAWRKKKALESTISLSHPTAKIPKGTSSRH